MKSQLIWQKSQIDYALMNYNNAVSSYNINPTQWALNNVNYAYRNYENAINTYNQTVNMYNVTPDTISQPVYLNYTILEGTVKIGWEIKIEITDGSQKYFQTGRAVLSDFVKVGTKRTDRNISNRSDDPLELNTDPEESIRLLLSACSELADGLWDYVNNNISLKYEINLDEKEIDIIKQLIHPWGFKNTRTEWPAWFEKSIAALNLPDFAKMPDQIKITDCKKYTSTLSSKEDIAEKAMESIVLLTAGDGDKILGTSSGAIISSDGLILTCAHGITGHDIIATTKKRKNYKCSIVFINTDKDVAVLRAEGLSTQTWLNIRMNNSVKGGESVMAFGNPSLSDNSIAHFAVTSGEVAVPRDESWGSPRIVANITIASGNSGGPLISLKDGKIVGVVLAISSPEYNNPITSRSATGMFALAAPATEFREWLGLVK